MYGFKGIKQTFYVIVGMLVLLFGLSYIQLAGFVGKLSTNAAKAQAAAHIDLNIRWLGEQFWTLRFWEQVVQAHSHPEADQQFGVTLERIRMQLKDVRLRGQLAGNVAKISSLLTQYEESFNRLMQFRTEQRLNETQVESNYQVLSSTILISQNLDLLKPLLNLKRFLDRYFSTHKDSEYKALRMVFTFLQDKLADEEIMDERLQSYMEKFDQLIERDFILEQEIWQINDEFDTISQDLMGLFLEISQNVATLSQETAAQAERLQEHIRWQLIVFSAVAFVILLFIILLIGKKIISPIQQMSSVAMQVKAGNSEARFISQERDEIASLGFAFNEMLDTIRQHHVRLEAQVEERTEELIETNAQLQQEITKHQQTERQLQKAKDAAEVANKAKSAFLANMSHELRTPLNAIIGFAQLLGHNLSLDAEQRENLRIIHENGEHLLTLINQVLDLSKIEAGHIQLNLGDLDLYSLLDDLENIFRLKAEAKGLAMHLERSPELPRYIQSDEIRLRQILLNLLSNAVKFTEQGAVILQASCRQWEEETLAPLENVNAEMAGVPQGPNSILLYFEVKDTGPGISSEEQEHLFEAFRQTQTGIETKGGTGLGLSISRKFIQLMGGDISVRSAVGMGTSFTFSFPGRTVSADSVTTKKPDRHVLALRPGQIPFRILVVDDQRNNRQLLTKLLNPLGFTIYEATNGEEAIGIWEKWRPDLIWMDMRMPVMNGYEATKQIKVRAKGRNAPTIIALTALSLAGEEQQALAAGCDGFLRKPFRETEVYDLLHEHLGVQFIYGSPDAQEPPSESQVIQQEIPIEELQSLPGEMLERLKRSAIIADIKDILSVIQDIRQYNESVAERLLNFAEDYEYTKILQLLQSSGSKKSIQ